ncbi:EG45-like domain containing protein [Tanacetum coccineum]
MIAKVHSGMFTNGKACGTKYRVRCLSGTNKAIRNACTGNTVDVMVVDRCETCAANELQLTQEAFSKIAKFQELCEEVSNVVNEREDVLEELERLSGNHVAKETAPLLRRGQKHDLYKMTRL